MNGGVPDRTLLGVRNLNVRFSLLDGDILAVRDASFSVDKGSSLGLVGESGCGKSVSAFSVMRLVAAPGRIDSGEILYRGRNLLALGDEDMRRVRGKEIGMIFQEPMTSLNPVFTVGYQITESVRLHLGYDKIRSREWAVEMLASVGIPSPSKRFESYPHEFSGGMRQRVMIAMSLAVSPSLLIADEPTTALDVTIQAQILDLLLKLQEDRGMSLLLITHDLGIVANTTDRIAIMYAGEIVETGTTRAVFSDPRHPYTRGLFEAIPRLGRGGKRLKTISGTVPAVTGKPTGCVFHPRCPIGIKACLQAPIPMRPLPGGRAARCIRA